MGEQDEPAELRGALSRRFPDTPAGRAAALAWEETVAGQRSTGRGATGSGERITGETTRRTLATAAARAIDKIQQDVRELTRYERENLEPGQIERQIRSVLSLFGFESVQELQQEMRTLRLGGVGAGGAPATGGAGEGGAAGDEVEIPPELIDEVMSENPDATEAELIDMVLERMGGGS